MNTAAGEESSPAPAPEDLALNEALAHALGVVKAFAKLLDAEIDLARCSMRALLIAALVLPIATVGLWLCLIATAIAALQMLGLSWLAAVALCTCVQVAAIFLLLSQMRRWGRDLSLPKSRAVLRQLRAPLA